MGQLDAAFLGVPRVRHNDLALTFPTRKALALLVYLAVEGGLHARDKLAALLWPDTDSMHARAMLRYTLAGLRQTLRDSASSPHLIVEREALGLDRSSGVSLDVDTLPTLEALRSAALADLQAAAQRCQGAFLDGFSLPDAPEFEEWARLQRESWQRYTEHLLDRLSARQIEAGLFAEAIGTLQRWRAESPLNEEAHRRLIREHLAAGDRSAALRAYESCRHLLEVELHVDPSPETQALAERIRAADLPPNEVRLEPRAARVFEGPPVGRDSEFERLAELYALAARGQPQVAILSGEPGIGKSRLAREFVSRLIEQGADVLQGRAFQTGGRLPYQPLVDALRPRLERENAPEDLLTDTWLVELGRLLPELHDRYPDLPDPAIEEAAARMRLFEAIARLGQALGQRAPVVLSVDDVQWTDVGSLDALQYAGRRWTDDRTPILLILSVRSEALAGGSALGDWVTALPRSIRVTRLELGPITADDTRRFVLSVVVSPDAAQIDAFARWLYAETAGQPLFVVETLRALLERELVVSRPRADQGWAIELPLQLMERLGSTNMLPPGVREVIRARVTQLIPAARDLLAAGSVLGHGFSFDQLCDVAGLDEDDALRAIEEVLGAHVVREATTSDGSAAGGYVFAHDRIRDVVYAETSSARRRVFHRRALESLKDTARAAELAQHALNAGLEGEGLRLSQVAGDDALRLLAARDALDHYQRALEIAMRIGTRADTGELHARCGKALARLGRWVDARGELETSLTELDQDHADLRAEVLVDLLEVSWWWLDVPSVRRRAAELADLAQRLDRADLHAHALSWQSATIAADGDVAGSIAHAEHWFARSRELDVEPPPPVRAYSTMLYYWLGRVDEAIEHSRECVHAARAANHASAAMFALPHLGLALATRGSYAEAQQTFEEAQRFGREYGIGTLLARATAISAGYHLDLFDFAGHEEAAEEARDLSRSLNFAPPAISAGIDLLFNYARQGDVGRAESLIDEVAEVAAQATAWHGWLWRIRISQARAEIALARHDWECALELANDAIEVAHRSGRLKYEVLGLTSRGQALLALGQTKAAISTLRRAVALARPVGDRPLFLRPALALLAVAGDNALAAETADAAERIASALMDTRLRAAFARGLPSHLLVPS